MKDSRDRIRREGFGMARDSLDDKDIGGRDGMREMPRSTPGDMRLNLGPAREPHEVKKLRTKTLPESSLDWDFEGRSMPGFRGFDIRKLMNWKRKPKDKHRREESPDRKKKKRSSSKEKEGTGRRVGHHHHRKHPKIQGMKERPKHGHQKSGGKSGSKSREKQRR